MWARFQEALILRQIASTSVLLRARAPKGLHDDQRRGRAWALEELDRYRARRQLPRNTYVRGLSPVFVDTEGRRCAVAHLLGASGDEDLVERTRAGSNLARIREMHDEDLSMWARRHGLTTWELARIQPGYLVVDAGLTASLLALLVTSSGLLGTALLALTRATRAWIWTAAAATALGSALLMASAWLWNTKRCPDVSVATCLVPWSGVARSLVVVTMLFAVVLVAWFRLHRAHIGAGRP